MLCVMILYSLLFVCLRCCRQGEIKFIDLLFSDCPRDTEISPSIACNAGTTLTCSTSCYPAASFLWIDNEIGEVIKHGPTIVIPLGKYDLTCMAYMYANCTNGYYSTVAFPDGVTTEGFPFDSLLNRTANHTMRCSDNATISGYTVGECANICRAKQLTK